MFTDEELKERNAIRHEGKIYKFIDKANTENEADYLSENYEKEGYAVLKKKNTEGCGYGLYVEWKSLNEGVAEFEQSELQNTEESDK